DGVVRALELDADLAVCEVVPFDGDFVVDTDVDRRVVATSTRVAVDQAFTRAAREDAVLRVIEVAAACDMESIYAEQEDPRKAGVLDAETDDPEIADAIGGADRAGIEFQLGPDGYADRLSGRIDDRSPAPFERDVALFNFDRR